MIRRKTKFVGLLLTAALAAPQPSLAKISYTGTPDDTAAFEAMLKDCAAKSMAFKNYVNGVVDGHLKDKSPKGGIDQDKDVIDIQLVRDAGDFIDDAESRGGYFDEGKGKDEIKGVRIRVNLTNLDRLPNPDVNKGQIQQAPGTSWGMTRCELMMHFLAEARKMINYQARKPTGSPHNDAIPIQNEVRENFGQRKKAPCHAQNFGNDLPRNDPNRQPYREIAYKDKDNQERKVTPKNQVQIDYGGGHVEVLWFLDGKLQMAFFNDDKQIDRKDLTLPNDKPAAGKNKKELNPDYVSAPRTSSESLFVMDCPPPPAPAATRSEPKPKQKCVAEGGLAGMVNDVACQIQHS